MASATVALPASTTAPAIHLSFFTRLKNWLKEHLTHVPAAEVQVSSAVNYIVPFVEELDTLLDPAAALVVNPILDKVKTGLAALALTIKDASPAGTANVQSILASLATNATALETAFQVKDASTQARATSILTLISGEVSAIAADFPVPAANSTVAISAGIGNFFKDLDHGLAEAGKGVAEVAVAGAVIAADARPPMPSPDCVWDPNCMNCGDGPHGDPCGVPHAVGFDQQMPCPCSAFVERGWVATGEFVQRPKVIVEHGPVVGHEHPVAGRR